MYARLCASSLRLQSLATCTLSLNRDSNFRHQRSRTYPSQSVTLAVLIDIEMRLLNVETFKLESYDKTWKTPPYLILSHRWGEDEVLYEDLQELPNDKEIQDLQRKIRDIEQRFESLEHQLATGKHVSTETQRSTSQQESYTSLADKAGNEGPGTIDLDSQYSHLRRARQKGNGWNKVSNCCKEAKALGFSYVWIDTCCISKDSSSELSEAINSMFSWYSDASICIAYLSDVSFEDAINEFRRSHWFSRGWTMQELIAPDDVWFYSKDWQFLGLRSVLASETASITSIDDSVFYQHCQLKISRLSVAARLSWAANRSTTRAEDRVYSLLGLFGVNMPTIYGEGEQAAFFRLQVEIFKASPEHSIFAW
jgi:hypothetical protein